MLHKKLESELKCGYCKKFLRAPRILCCGHSICEKCGVENVEKVFKITKTISFSKSNNNMSTFQTRQGDSTVSHVNTVVSVESEQDAFSESDSGIFLSHGSLGSDNVGMNSITQPGATFQILCPVCSLPSIATLYGCPMNYFPSNVLLQSLVNRYQKENGIIILEVPTESCQLCVENKAAAVFCEQCQIRYCLQCKDNCHPMRGPLEKHNIVDLIYYEDISDKTSLCNYHNAERLEFVCVECHQLVCQQCKAGLHFRHDVISVGAHAKLCKVSLSKCIQRISEKVKSGTEFIQNLSRKMGHFKTEYDNVIKEVDDNFNKMKEMLENKRAYCHAQIKIELERKESMINEQMREGTAKISQTTSMLHLAVETIKESNMQEFYKISNQILKRALRTEQCLLPELNDLKPKCYKEMELKLESEKLIEEINNLKFKSFKCPESPKFVLDRCSVWDNFINVVWNKQGAIEVDNYILYIDDGAGGLFKTVYYGPETICTIENLHFAANYRVKIKAINEAGVSHCGDIIRLATSKNVNFHMLPNAGHKKNGFNLSLSGMTLESLSSNAEDTVFLANTGFIKGIHYWEFKVESYDGLGEPSFGIAMEYCVKNKRLGSDIFSWGMYMNSKRSWFHHNSEHYERMDVQMYPGLRIGIRLDLENQKLSYFLNDQPHGPIAFNQLLTLPSRNYNQLLNPNLPSSNSHNLTDGSVRSKMLFPAVSVSHGIKLNLLCGLAPPLEDSCSEEEGEGEDLPEIMTPSLTKRIDMSYLLENIAGGSDSSSKQLTL